MPSRRTLLRSALLTLPLLPFTRAWARLPKDPAKALQALEDRHGGRLGVTALDTGNGQMLAHRGGERFAMCSTFKLLLAAQVLAAVDAGKERLDRRLGRIWRDREPLDQLEPFNLLHRHQMMEQEPPDHTRLRRAVADYLEHERREVAQMSDYLGEHTPFRKGDRQPREGEEFDG